MSQSPKRVGLIGLSAQGSWASRAHLPYFNRTKEYKIVALQNSSKKSAEAAAEKYGLGAVSTYDNPSSIANDPNVDIVAVSVNVPQHYKLLKPALEAKKDIFVEWPLAANLSEAVELTNLAKQNGVKTLVGLQARQNPSVLKAKELVESGKLGKILGTTMYGHGGIFGPTIQEGFLYALPVEAGANLITIPFGHCVDALCYVLGEIDSLSATVSNHRPELSLVGNDGKEIKKVRKTAHDYIGLSGTLFNGGNVDIQFAGGASRTGRNFYWEINGTEGSLVLDDAPIGHIQMNPLVVKFAGNEPGAKLEVVEHTKVEKGDGSYNVGKAWDAFIGLGKEEGHKVTTFKDALLRHKMIDAIYRSAEKGTRERYL